MTFIRTGTNGRNYVVNVTKSNHSLRYGIVIRGLECQGDGVTMHNYGEGNGWLQDLPFGLSNDNINNIWYWSSEYALESVTGRKYTINGIDWTENSTSNSRYDNLPIR